MQRYDVIAPIEIRIEVAEFPVHMEVAKSDSEKLLTHKRYNVQHSLAPKNDPLASTLCTLLRSRSSLNIHTS